MGKVIDALLSVIGSLSEIMFFECRGIGLLVHGIEFACDTCVTHEIGSMGDGFVLNISDDIIQPWIFGCQ